MAHWYDLENEVGSIADEVDLCGCLLPNDAEVKAAPNSRRFILQPTDHAKNGIFHLMCQLCQQAIVSDQLQH